MSYTVLESPLLAASSASCAKLSANSRLSLLQVFLTSLSFSEYSFFASLFRVLVLALFRLSLTCRLLFNQLTCTCCHPRLLVACSSSYILFTSLYVCHLHCLPHNVSKRPFCLVSPLSMAFFLLFFH